MGCFNLSGFYSHAPIQEGDRIGAILCVVEQGKDGCPIGATGFGYHPVMAPVYGQYNDYGGIENIDESYTTKLFKEVVGIDFTTFIDMNHRNTETTLSDEDNGNQYDNIPEYQSYMRKIIPGAKIYDHSFLPKESTTEIDEMDRKLNEWVKAREMRSCVQIIFEHEDVLKSLEIIGLLKFTNYMESHVQETIEKTDHPSIMDKYTPEELANLPEEERKKIEESIELLKELNRESFKSTIEGWISLGDCNYSEFDNALYFKGDAFETMTNPDKFSAIKEIYSIAHALDACGGYFCASKYDSQESWIYAKSRVNDVISKILKDKQKGEEI